MFKGTLRRSPSKVLANKSLISSGTVITNGSSAFGAMMREKEARTKIAEGREETKISTYNRILTYTSASPTTYISERPDKEEVKVSSRIGVIVKGRESEIFRSLFASKPIGGIVSSKYHDKLH
jgi:hypothetical protein